MTALTAHKTREVKGGTQEFLGEFAVAASTTIYNGALVMLNASGYVVPATDAAGEALGFVDEGADNSAGSNGDLNVKVYTGTVKVATTTTAQANVGQVVYCEDDDTVDDASGGGSNIKCGILIERESATEGWVKLVPTTVLTGA